MTKDEALKLPADQKLDRIVCERVFGFHSFKDYYNGGGHYLRPDGSECGLYELPKVSQRIADAWEVVEKLRSVRAYVSVTADETGWFTDCFTAIKVDFIGGLGDTAPLAICRAAIQACWQD